MKKLIFILTVFALFNSARAQVTKVQHFYLQTRDASALFTMFNKTFGLPVIYDYQQFPGFSSGGLSFGNITFEFVGFSGGENDKAIFKGMAFEPKQHMDGIVPILDNLHIAHTSPDVATIKIDGQEQPFYTNVDLQDLTYKQRHVFICDYADRDFISQGSAKGDSLLKATKGGPLGIIGLKSIIIGTTDKAKEAMLWVNIPGIKHKNDDLFGFNEGPDILLEQYSSNCIKEIVVKVQSAKKAADFLARQKCLKIEKGRLLIDPEKVYGLRIILED